MRSFGKRGGNVKNYIFISFIFNLLLLLYLTSLKINILKKSFWYGKF